MKCELCNELYSQARLPRILLCGHTLCDGCLSQRGNDDQPESKEVECPECRQKSAVPGFDFNQAILRLIVSIGSVAPAPSSPSPLIPPLPSSSESSKSSDPSHVFHASAAAWIPPAPSIASAKCTNCDEKDATVFCPNACGVLCDGCSASIHSLRAFKSHVMCTIDKKSQPLVTCVEYKNRPSERCACVRCDYHCNRDAVPVAETAVGESPVQVLQAVEGVEFDQGCVQWSRLENALQYEMQVARHGDFGERKGDELDVKDECYFTAYQGPKTRCDVPYSESGEFAARVRAKFEGGWGPFSSIALYSYKRPPVRMDYHYLDPHGCVFVDRVPDAKEFEAQIAGPFDHTDFEQVYRGPFDNTDSDQAKRHRKGSAVFPMPVVGRGVYFIRVRFLYDAGWSSFSEPWSFNVPYYNGALGLHWDVTQKSSGILLSPDPKGLIRVARLHHPSSQFGSVMSAVPFGRYASSPYTASFEVRMDNVSSRDILVGVTNVLPDSGRRLGSKGFGFGLHARGYFSSNDEKSSAEAFTSGDVIRIKLQYSSLHGWELSFTRNNNDKAHMRFPFPQASLDPFKPMYAAVTLAGPDDQVTLL